MKAKTFVEKEWLKKVSQVFDTRPRDASGRKVVWLPRDEQERKILELLTSTKHICVDGPTGTGKTSLAITTLGLSKVKYVPIQIVSNMSWREFCKNLVRRTPANVDRKLSSEFKVGLETGLPTATMQVTLGSTSHHDQQLIELAKGWTEHDICHLMQKENKTLLIDDFEKASDEIVTRVADMAKLLTQTYSSKKCKLVIVGTDDIFRRIFSKDPSLEARLSEISLGAFPSKNTSWKYLLLGFEALDLAHPGNSKLASERSKLETCINAVFEAANGLPKSLTDLGWEIASRSYRRPGITASDISSQAKRIVKNKARSYRRLYPDLMAQLRGNATVRDIFRFLLESGVGQIFYMDDIINGLHEKISSGETEKAVDRLVELDLLTQTGINNDVLFFKDLPFAHTLGVISRNPGDFGLNSREFAPLSQMSLPLDNE